MKIITEEMRYRKKMCDYALKYGKTVAARKYHTNRQFVYRQLEKYDGTVKSLALKSRRPKNHPNAHQEEELKLLKEVSKRYKCDGNAEVYVQARKRGYKRSYGSMYKQLKRLLIETQNKRTRSSYTKHKEVRGSYPGEKVQVDIKYVLHYCLDFETTEMRYYQITALDEYSRKRVLEIVEEKSCYNTSVFVLELEKKLGFKIKTIQTDNGSEFVNNQEKTREETYFEKTLKKLGIIHKRTRPYSPWQNGKVERSHRIDNKFYERQEFKSREDMKKKVKRYNSRYNNISREVLNFKSPNEIVKEYFETQLAR
jgi:transposase